MRLDTLANEFLDPATAEMEGGGEHGEQPRDAAGGAASAGAGELAGQFVDWLTAELGARGDREALDARVVLRRMNRAEYNNTIRDLVGVNFQPAEKFPEDPPAGGFDNIGAGAHDFAAASRTLLRRGAADSRSRAGRGRAAAGAQVALRAGGTHDKGGGPRPGEARRAATITAQRRQERRRRTASPWCTTQSGTRASASAISRCRKRANTSSASARRAGCRRARRCVESARGDARQAARRGDGEEARDAKYQDELFARDLAHFETHRMYDYGPPRVKISHEPRRHAAEWSPRWTSTRPSRRRRCMKCARYFTTQQRGVTLEYAYSVPTVLENAGCRAGRVRACRSCSIDWIELEGPIYAAWPPASHHARARRHRQAGRRTRRRMRARCSRGS